MKFFGTTNVKIGEIDLEVEEEFFYNEGDVFRICNQCAFECNVPDRIKDIIDNCSHFTLISQDDVFKWVNPVFTYNIYSTTS
jgi:hypothetical protein